MIAKSFFERDILEMTQPNLKEGTLGTE